MVGKEVSTGIWPGGLTGGQSGLGEQGGFWRHGLFAFKGEWSLVDEDGIEGGGGELGDGVWPGLESEKGLDEILGDLVRDLPSTTTPLSLTAPPTANANEPISPSEPGNGGSSSIWQETPVAALIFNSVDIASNQTAFELFFGDPGPFNGLESHDHQGKGMWPQNPPRVPTGSKANPGGGSIDPATCAKYNGVSDRLHKRSRRKIQACDACRQSFCTRKDLDRHRKLHLGLFVTCPHCEKPFQGARTDNLMRHIRTIHKELL